MGIRFRCVHCGQQLNVKNELSGKRGFCPHCRGAIEIPAVFVTHSATPPATARTVATPSGAPTGEPAKVAPVTDRPTAAQARDDQSSNVASGQPSISRAPVVAEAQLVADPLSAAPALRWYVATRGGPQFGPAPAPTMSAWLAEGRIAADSLVWREDWPEWRPAPKVFPQVARPDAKPAITPGNAATGTAAVATRQQPREAAVQVRTGTDEGVAVTRRRRRARAKNLMATVVLGLLALVLIPVVWYVVVHR